MRKSIAAITATLFLVAGARAAINVQFQPRDLYNGYASVLDCKIASIDADAKTIGIAVESVVKGKFPAKTITLTAARDQALEGFFALEKDQQIIAFVGKSGRGGARDVIYYVGGGKWYKAKLSEKADDQWSLIGNADDGVDASSLDIMFAVFNGSVRKLGDLVRDLAAGRDYYPARPNVRFSAKKLDTLKKSVSGVALYDLNGDGRLDIVAASDAGNRLFLQNDKSEFQDHTAKAGLSDTSARSVSVADANGDGAPDLLLDATLYTGEEGRWTKSDALPPSKDVLSAAFVELNRDGLPDVVVSQKGGGLTAYRNELTKTRSSGGFNEVTAEMGLNNAEAGAGGSGYFEAGDFDGDGHTDLLYLSGSGYLLTAKDGKFVPTPLGEEGEEAGLQTAAMAPVIEMGKATALILQRDGKQLIQSAKADFEEVSRYGNEIQDDTAGARCVVAADLTADGTIDFFIAAHDAGAENFFALNRGYGSFMSVGKYTPEKVFPTELRGLKVTSLIAGDVNGDGAIDLLVGAENGTLLLLMNETLTDRKAAPEVTTKADERRQIDTKLVTVCVKGPIGVVNASVRLKDETGRVVAAATIGSNIGTGSCGPAQVTLAARHPGAYQIEVVFSDGTKVSAPVDLSAAQARHQTIDVRHSPE